MCLQDGFIQVSFVVITIFANQRGLTDAAAVGIVEKIISILFLVPSSMMSTISALVAQNIGVGKHDRAKLTLKYVLMITVTYGLIMTIIVQFVSVPLVGLFTNDGAVAVSGAGYLRSYASVHFKDTLFPMGCAAPAGSLNPPADIASGRAHIVRWTMVLRRPKRSVDLQRCAVEVCHVIA